MTHRRQRHTQRPGRGPQGRHGQRGAALLLAMMIVALITTTAAGMVWLQTRAVHVEAAERARAQSDWIVSGALDWARLILREDFRSGQQSGRMADSLDEPWATALAESRLSSFLSADQDNNSEGGVEAFMSGGISDAQAHFNLRSLIDGNGKLIPEQAAGLQRLCDILGAPADTAQRIGAILARAALPPADTDAAIWPQQVADLVWLGMDAATMERLSRWVELLPMATTININTAPREVLVAAIDKLDVGTAERLVQARQRSAFQNLSEAQTLLGTGFTLDPKRVSTNTAWFSVQARMRLDDRVMEERALLQRDAQKVTVRRRERSTFTAAPS